MKMSLRLMIYSVLDAASATPNFRYAHILVSEVLEEFQLAVGALGQDRSAEGLHDLLDSHGLAGELILCRAAPMSVSDTLTMAEMHTRPVQKLPYQQAAGQCTFALSVA
jgi:hypothetical protein